MPKQGMIYSLEKTLASLVEGQKQLRKSIGRIEKKLAKLKTADKGKPGPKPGRKRGRKPGPKPKAKRGRKPKKGPRKKPGPKPKHKVCKVKGCNKPHYAKGYCLSHYQMSRRKKKVAKGGKKKARRGRPPKKKTA